MADINFKNKEGILLMTFSEFSFHDSVIKRVCFEVNANYDCFKVKTRVESERFDFEDLIIGLSKIYQREWKSIEFNPIEKQFYLRFDLQENGEIIVIVTVRDLAFKGKLEFEYLTDQSFIPDLISEIGFALEGDMD